MKTDALEMEKKEGYYSVSAAGELNVECLFGIDTADITEAVRKGRFDKGMELISNNACFAGAIDSDCDASCDKACMKICPYLRSFEQYPGACLRTVAINLIVLAGMGARMAPQMTNGCSLCGLCAEVCPAGIDMGRINLETRRIMWEQGQVSPAIHDFPLRDMEFSNSEEVRLLQHQKGMRKSRWLFFPGCQLSASLPREVKKTYAFLMEHLEGGVGVLLQCCGAPAEWAGRSDMATRIRERFRNDWQRTGKPMVISGCPSCYRFIKNRLPEIPVRFLSEILTELPVDRIERGEEETGRNARTRMLAYHDPCASRHENAIQDSSRKLLESLGYRISELPSNRNRTSCCGYGGLQYHTNPEHSREAVQTRTSGSELPYATSCSNCRDFFMESGKETFHILELVFPSEKEDRKYESMDFSSRRDARKQLRKELALSGSWNSMAPGDLRKPLVHISDEVRAIMKREHILFDDIDGAIGGAENSGRRVGIGRNGRFAAGYRPQSITYWVEYSKEKGKYILHNCYSHRVKIAGAGSFHEGAAAVEGIAKMEHRSDKPMDDAESTFGTAGSDGGCMICTFCNMPLAAAKVEMTYMGRVHHADMPVCGICGQVYVSEDFARGALMEIEKMLEGNLPDSESYVDINIEEL